MRKLAQFSTRSDAIRGVEPKKMEMHKKFLIYKVEES